MSGTFWSCREACITLKVGHSSSGTQSDLSFTYIPLFAMGLSKEPLSCHLDFQVLKLNEVNLSLLHL